MNRGCLELYVQEGSEVGSRPSSRECAEGLWGEGGSMVELNENVQTPPYRHFLKSSSSLSDVLYSFACYLISRLQKF